MKIFMDNERIVINTTKDVLLPKHINQLDYFGFHKEKNKDIYFYVGNKNVIDVVNKISKYFIDNNIRITLSDEINKLVEDNKTNSMIFSVIREKSKMYKDGIIDDREFNEFHEFIKNKIYRKLKPHQIKASFHHYMVRNAANFSVPGSGKTTTIITVYERLRIMGDVNILFVVGPTSSFTAWKHEFFETLGRNAKYKILSGGDKNSRIQNYYNLNDETELILTSFQSFSNDVNHIIDFFSSKLNKVFFVVDEAHYIKQINGVWAKAIIRVGRYSITRCILTGTPCPKSYTDLFNLFDFLWGENVAISNTNKIKIISLAEQHDFESAGGIVKECIDPLFYRVRKKDLGLSEPICHEPILIEMNKYERIIYDAVYNKIIELSSLDYEKNIMALIDLKKGRIMRLRQLTSYAKLLSSALTNYSEDITKDFTDVRNIIKNYDDYETPAKIEALQQLIKCIRENELKVLIWTNFICTIKLIHKHLANYGLKCHYIYGETPIIDTPDGVLMTREKIIIEFLQPESSIDILIANPGACAESISLHKGCYNAIYYDLSYNCAQFLQSLDRIHRVGGSENKVANYYFLQYNNTIDSDIMKNLLHKRDSMYRIIENDSDIYNLDISIYDDSEGDDNAYDRIIMR